MSSTDADHPEEDDVPAGDDEDTGAQVAPIVQLEEVAVSTGEEDEQPILDLSAFPLSLSLSNSLPIFVSAILLSELKLCRFCLMIRFVAKRNCTVSIRNGTSGRNEALEP